MEDKPKVGDKKVVHGVPCELQKMTDCCKDCYFYGKWHGISMVKICRQGFIFKKIEE